MSAPTKSATTTPAAVPSLSDLGIVAPKSASKSNVPTFPATVAGLVDAIDAYNVERDRPGRVDGGSLAPFASARNKIAVALGGTVKSGQITALPDAVLIAAAAIRADQSADKS